MSVYEEEIESLSKILYNYMKKRRPDVPDEVHKRAAKLLATLFILSAEWGAGDALAGFQLLKVRYNKEFIRRIHTILEGLGVKNLPQPRPPLDIYCWHVMEKADFEDEEVNKIMRELHKLGVSGGRYIPEFFKRMKE